MNCIFKGIPVKTDSCVVIDLSAYKAKKEFDTLVKLVSAIASDRRNLAFSVSIIKNAIMRTRAA